MKPAGYSGTPLPRKLGIKPEGRSLLVGAPREIAKALGADGTSAPRPPIDFVLLFVKTEADLKKNFVPLAQKLQSAGMLWVAWPKKASGVATDLSFDVVQKLGLASGLVDVKICAIDDTWSGLKFVYRVKDRPR